MAKHLQTGSLKTINGETLEGTGDIVITGGTASTLDSLSDVVITTPANGQALVYNGTGWVNQTVTTSGTTSLDLDGGDSNAVYDYNTEYIDIESGGV